MARALVSSSIFRQVPLQVVTGLIQFENMLHLGTLANASILIMALGFIASVVAGSVPAGTESPSAVPASTPQGPSELEKVFIKLEGIREKCLVEELPEKTVVLGKFFFLLQYLQFVVKHAASAWNSQTNTRSDVSLQLLITVRVLSASSTDWQFFTST